MAYRGGGSKPGERRGGRQKGSLNKKTIERKMVQRMVEERTNAAVAGRKIAKEVLDEFMQYCASVAVIYRPFNEDGEPNPKANETKFFQYMRFVGEFAGQLVGYQSPKYAALAVVAPPPTAGSQKRSFTINVFDESGHKVAAVIDGETVDVEQLPPPMKVVN